MSGIDDLIFEIQMKPKFFTAYVDDRANPGALIIELRRAQARGYLQKHELDQIAIRKSPRRAKLVSENREEEVESLTRLAFDTAVIQSEEVRIGILSALKGIRVPTAPCILSWVFPDRWAVIDRRSWATLAHFGLVDDPKAGSALQPAHWAAYCMVIRSLQSRLGDRKPQEIDRWLYGYAREKGWGPTK